MAWRDFLRVHPAADLFLLVSPDELKIDDQEGSQLDVIRGARNIAHFIRSTERRSGT